MELWNQVILPALKGVVQDMVGILPQLAGAIIILLVGWLVSKLIGNLIARLLNRLGLDRAAERTGINSFLENAGITRQVSWIVGRLVFWMLLLIFLLSAAEALHLTALAETLQKVVGFIPNVVAALLILVVGSLLARLAGRIVRGIAGEAGIDFAIVLEKLVNGSILIAVVIIAIGQLEIESAVLDIAFGAILGAFGLAVALTLGMGTRSIAQNIICGFYARKIFRIGQRVRIEDQEGELIQFDTVNTKIRTPDGVVSLPNRLLIEGVARVIGEMTEEPKPSPENKR